MSSVLDDKEIEQEVKKDRYYYGLVELNDVLYLSHRCYRKIDTLHRLYHLKTLYLINNHIEKIRGLENCTELMALFLNGNRIKKIENLQCLKKLRVLNLENNFISVIENLDGLTNLEVLDLGCNRIGRTGRCNIESLRTNTGLRVLNLSSNQISEDIMEQLKQIQTVSVLYIMDNPIMEKYKYPRKVMIYCLQRLRFLNDKPVSVEERRMVNAYFEGGSDKEEEEKEQIQREKRKKQFEELRLFFELVN